MTDESDGAEPRIGERIRTWVAAVGKRTTRNRLRFLFAVLLLSSVGVVTAGALTNDLSTASKEAAPEAPPSDNITVITESGRAGTIIAYNPDGSILYYNNTRTKYFDVDPVEGKENVVEYTATDTINSEGPSCSQPTCARNYIERVNLETGETEVLFERVNHQETAGEWHDFDRVNDTHAVVADMLYDEVYMVDLGTESVTWLWDAQSDFSVADSGGAFPRDWTHLNDVEVLDDGRVMASLRNHDRVVFIEPGQGVQKNWTLGEEDNYDILNEQHNPDYIPAERGGPAVVVADSENNKIKEFQRQNGEWVQSWEWSDSQMQWPRDADRLPNGNTLISDSHGNRVFEVDQNGEIVWEVPSTLPYEAERLGTGPESANGRSAESLNLTSTDANSVETDSGTSSPFSWIADALESILPHRWTNGIYFAAPVWFGGAEFGAVTVILSTGILWVGAEIRWQIRDRGFRVRLSIERD